MDDFPSKAKSCPYTWDECWLLTIKGSGICEGCKYKPNYVEVPNDIEEIDIYTVEKQISNDYSCPVTNKPCDMVDSLGLRWCDGCTVNTNYISTKMFSNDAIKKEKEEIKSEIENVEPEIYNIEEKEKEEKEKDNVSLKLEKSSAKFGFLRRLKSFLFK